MIIKGSAPLQFFRICGVSVFHQKRKVCFSDCSFTSTQPKLVSLGNVHTYREHSDVHVWEDTCAER